MAVQRIGVYVDGFNLYYGGRETCRGTPGWKWLNIRALVRDLIDARPEAGWAGSPLHRIVYCTATLNPNFDPGRYQRQQTFIRALRASNSVDHIEYGTYISQVKRAPLATPDQRG